MCLSNSAAGLKNVPAPADMVAVAHLVLHKQACPQFTRVMNRRRRGGLAQQSCDS